MGIKFSATGLFEADVRKIIESPGKYFLNEEEADKLRGILKELSELHYTTEFDVNERFIAPHVDMNITREFVVSSRDPQRSGELFNEIHQVIGAHFVNVQTYIWMGEAFDELGIKDRITPDLQIAIERARVERSSPEHSWSMGEFNPNAAVRVFNERQSRGGRPEFDDYDEYS